MALRDPGAAFFAGMAGSFRPYMDRAWSMADAKRDQATAQAEADRRARLAAQAAQAAQADQRAFQVQREGARFAHEKGLAEAEVEGGILRDRAKVYPSAPVPDLKDAAALLRFEAARQAQAKAQADAETAAKLEAVRLGNQGRVNAAVAGAKAGGQARQDAEYAARIRSEMWKEAERLRAATPQLDDKALRAQLAADPRFAPAVRAGIQPAPEAQVKGGRDLGFSARQHANDATRQAVIKALQDRFMAGDARATAFHASLNTLLRYMELQQPPPASLAKRVAAFQYRLFANANDTDVSEAVINDPAAGLTKQQLDTGALMLQLQDIDYDPTR